MQSTKVKLLHSFMSDVVIAAIVGVLIAACLFVFLWWRQKKVSARVEEMVKGQVVIMPIEHVHFRAIESSGYSQTSGMGYIVLTKECLHFELALLEFVVSVPVERLRGAEFVRRLKGLSPVRQMLRVVFVNAEGEEDSIAVHVKDMEGWKASVEKLCKGNHDTHENGEM